MIIGPNAVILGYVLKSIPNSDFKMDGFDDRLRLQKLIYMVEAFGVYLGYDFSWYMRGPYCTRLARAGFELEQIIDKIPDNPNVKFFYEDEQKKFERCIKFIDTIMDSPDDLDRLEISSSIHLLAQNPSVPKTEILERVVSKMSPRAKNHATLVAQCEKMWDVLSKTGLLPDRSDAPPAPANDTQKPPLVGYSIKMAPEAIGSLKKAMIEKQQYGDVAFAVTLQDICEHNQALEPNESPAFMQRPSHVAQLVSDPKRNELLSFVTRQYR